MEIGSPPGDQSAGRNFLVRWTLAYAVSKRELPNALSITFDCLSAVTLGSVETLASRLLDYAVAPGSRSVFERATRDDLATIF